MLWFNKMIQIKEESNRLSYILHLWYAYSYSQQSYRQSKHTLDVVANNLIWLIKSKSDKLHISFDRNSYTREVHNGVEIRTGIGYNSLVKTIGMLEQFGVIDITKGYRNDSNNKMDGYIKLTEKGNNLIHSCVNLKEIDKYTITNVVVLRSDKRDKDKKIIPFNQTEEVSEMVKDLTEYNKYMSKQDIISIQGNMVVTDLTRIFSRGDKNLSKGGRLYATGNNYQNMSKVARKHLKINGENVKEIDFKYIHAGLLASEVGYKIPDNFDPYKVPDYLFNVDYNVLSTFKEQVQDNSYDPCRNLSKVAFMILLNSKGTISSCALTLKDSFTEDLLKEDISRRSFVGINYADYEQILVYISENLHFISDYLFSDVGVRLMRKDSDIMMIILNECMVQDIPALCIHDSVIVKESDVDKTISIMKDAYRKVVGSVDNFKVEIK